MASRKLKQSTDLQTDSPERSPGPRRAPSGGTLLTGNPGNRGGSGPAPSVIRERCRGSFMQRVNILEALADSEKRVAARDRIKAIDTLGRYGLMTGKLDIQEVQQRLQRTIAIIEQTLDPDAASRLLKAIDPVWNPTR